jgi:hypothetical protein
MSEAESQQTQSFLPRTKLIIHLIEILLSEKMPIISISFNDDTNMITFYNIYVNDAQLFPHKQMGYFEVILSSNQNESIGNIRCPVNVIDHLEVIYDPKKESFLNLFLTTGAIYSFTVQHLKKYIHILKEIKNDADLTAKIIIKEKKD